MSPLSRDRELVLDRATDEGRSSFGRLSMPVSRRQSAVLSRESSLNSKTPQSNMITRNRQPSVTSLEKNGMGGSIERAGTPGQQHCHLSNQPSDAIQVLLLESALHMADISNPVKPWDIYQRWCSRVMEEFYNQGTCRNPLVLFSFIFLYPYLLPLIIFGLIDFFICNR